MKKLIAPLFFLLMACASEVKPESLNQLNGYWEIEKVVYPDGAEKKYDLNELVDFFELQELKGFRKKVRPNFDGTYEVSADAESFQIQQKDEGFFIMYSNTMSSWEEQILSLEKNRFSVVNESNFTYHYKRYKPLLDTK